MAETMATRSIRKRKAKPKDFKQFFTRNDHLELEEKEKVPKREYLQGLFNVERIISCRGRGQV